jgi:predicted O-methyltransferase YrrM
MIGLFILFISNQIIMTYSWTMVTSQSRRKPSKTTHTRRRRISFPLSSSSISEDGTIHEETTTTITRYQSPIFGEIRRIRMPGEEESSFVGTMGVPTFASSSSTTTPNIFDNTIKNSKQQRQRQRRVRGLEGVLNNHGPAFIVDNVLSKDICEQIIMDCEHLNFGNYESGKNFHGAMQIVVNSDVANSIGQIIAPHIDINQVEETRREMIMNGSTYVEEDDDDVRLFFVGLNRRWRIYRYDSSGKETFAPHIDAAFPPSGLSEDGNTLIWDDSSNYGDDKEIVSRLTVLIYLNDDFIGGETNFYRPVSLQDAYDNQQISSLIASVRPVTGSVLLFPQGVGEEAVEYARKAWPLHEGSPVTSGRPKYVIRSDALFVTQKDKLLLDDELFCYDHLVRQAFLPKSTIFSKEFLSYANSLYNPHMGVENLGPFLYSFLRMTKCRKIVEIGAGFTSIWILQALKDNDEEMNEARSLQETGKCKLLNYDWTITSIVDGFDDEPASLLCIDNCEHQKETATGATAVAKSLGLDSYFEFQRGDAFDLDLASCDVLWCDFGVGARMKEFVSKAWRSIRPGGFLLCHSTLTNDNTRQWLEAIRNRLAEEVTGIPPEEYVELSLLEPHKRFQNSVSILQKRKSSSGDVFEEPVYSQYA